MSYLPGVPNMSPAPVSTAPAGGKGGTTGIAKIAATVGKPGRSQELGSMVGRHASGTSTHITGGDPLAQSLQHYGKKPPAMLGGTLGGNATVDPTAHAGASMIRGGAGGIKPRGYLKYGGLGPGRMGAPGPNNTDYSMTDTDPE
jgi:hypothetical protein